MANLETILGRPFDQIEYGDLPRLIASAAAEDEHLDFKSALYEKGDDLAADVVAMANTAGGSIVIGLAEREGVAAGLAPVPLSDASMLKMRQWIGSYTTPHVDLRIRSLASPDATDSGAYLIDVLLSGRRPHAVVKNEALRYYERSGPRNRVLNSSEVADAYYRSFARARDQETKIRDHMGDARALLAGPTGMSPCVVVTLQPMRQGRMEISGSRLRELEEWATEACGDLQRGPMRRRARAWPYLAKVVVGDRDSEDEPAGSYLLRLNTDGGASAAAALAEDSRAPGCLWGDDLIKMAAGSLRVAVDHAVRNCGVRGEALAMCHLVYNVSTGIKLGQEIRFGWEPYPLSRTLARSPIGEPRAIDMAAILDSPVEWLAATRLVLTDLMHEFRLPEVLHINEDGSLNSRWWQPARLDGWKSVASVPRVDREIRLV